MKELEQATREILVAQLNPGLRAAVDRLRGRGLARRGIVEMVSSLAAQSAERLGRPGGGALVVLQVQAYLDTVEGGAP